MTRNGVPDYWLASLFFCPIIDYLAFEVIFIMMIGTLIGRRPELEDKIFNFVRMKGYFHIDLY
jgi:hypothetical protein